MAAGEAVAEYRGDKSYHASLSGQEYAALLARIGFAIVEPRVEDPSGGGRTAWLAWREGG